MSTNDLNSHQLAFDRIEKSYLSTWCRFHPEEALEAGIEDYAGQLRPHDEETIGIQIVLNEKCLAALDEIEFDDLDPERKIHYQVLHGCAELDHHSLMDHDWRHRDPTLFLPINALHQLTIRPVEDLANALQQRLAAIPSHIRDAKNYLSTVPSVIPKVWLDMALAEAVSGVDYLHHLHQHPVIADLMSNDDAIEQSIADAAKALESFSQSLTRLKPQCSGNFSCGRAHFERLLKQQHFLPINSQSLREFGQRLFEQTKQELDAELNNSDETITSIQQHHPETEQLLPHYQQEMQAAQDFLREYDLVSLPTEQTLTVVTTPEFLQHQIPFAAYLDPSIADLSQTGYYYVTPPNSQEELAEHNFAAISQTSVHEAWPGHHLQFVTANHSNQGSQLLRRLHPSATLYEGWALYCEQMMLEQGFERHKGQRIIMLRDRLWRALRIIIDVEIHTQDLSLEDAAQKMVDALGFSHEQALGELNWYSQSPTVPMSYAVGWALINALRDIINPENTTELKDFHDKLLASGSVALSLVIQRQFGHDVWQKCCRHVFGEQL
ncbi:MAG: DUF885 domain-containing protein [Gammaproteobacteria bacterium]|nr:DUF885 domain-containing protein [Gammaproteobacteria bacterium]